MAIYTTYEQVGKREDVSNVISNIDPTKTPFLSSLQTERVHNTYYQWQEDHLASVALNAQSEGFTPASKTITPTVMRSNYTQILQKTVSVARTADAIQTYGRAKELAYQLSLASAEIKRDLEFSMVGNAQTATAGNDTTPGAGTARQFASVQAMIDSSTTVAAGTAALTEDMLVTANQDLYTVGGDASIFLIKPADAVKVANFQFRASGSSTERSVLMKNGDTKITNAVDFYRSPFGSQRVVLDRFILSSTAILYDPAMWRLAVLRPWTRTTLAITGDNLSVMLVGEYGLKHRNFKGSALISGLT
jgi:Family of unknown function (DUF5309)